MNIKKLVENKEQEILERYTDLAKHSSAPPEYLLMRLFSEEIVKLQVLTKNPIGMGE